MGTIGHQPERRDYVYDCSNALYLDMAVRDMARLARDNSVKLRDVIAIRDVLAREAMVHTMRQDGDFRDEHAAGIASALRSIGEDIGGAVASIAEVLENKL